MMRTAWLTVGAVALSWAVHARADERTDRDGARRPNILLILADDLGYRDLGCYGNERMRTPNLDRLAGQGMRFTDAYAAAPVCSPTRASILTGQAPARLGITNHVPDHPSYTPPDSALDPAPSRNHLDPAAVTIAERLKEAGYATALVGKWHLAGPWRAMGRGDPDFYPERQGFDINIGGCAYGGPPTFFDPYGIHNLPPRRRGEYLPDRLADEAVRFVREHREQPFFLCLWTYQVHWPYEAPRDRILPYVDRVGPGLKNPVYAAMVESLDRAVGRVLAALDQEGLADDTLVVFLSDNGGYTQVCDNAPLRGGKGFLYEGGVRVPQIVRWPGVVEPGTTCSTPVISTDLFPTLLAAAGLEPDPGIPLDGADITPLLRGKGLDRDAIFFHAPSYAWHGKNRLGGAMRQGRYKLIERFDDGSLELYDVVADPGESVNLAEREEERARAMRDRLKAWRESVGALMPRPRSRDD